MAIRQIADELNNEGLRGADVDRRATSDEHQLLKCAGERRSDHRNVKDGLTTPGLAAKPTANAEPTEFVVHEHVN